MMLIGYIMVLGYLGISLRLFPAGNKSFDVFKLHPRFLPSKAKYVGLLWILFIFVYSAITSDLNPSTNRVLLVGVNFGLVIIIFSKEKNEDEYSNHIRLKAMYVAIVSMFLLAGVFSSFELINPDSFSKNAYTSYMMIFNATLIVYLIYFYFTKYRWQLLKTD